MAAGHRSSSPPPRLSYAASEEEESILPRKEELASSLRSFLASLVWKPTTFTQDEPENKTAIENRTSSGAEYKINELHLKMKDPEGHAASWGEVTFLTNASSRTRTPVSKFACLADDTDMKSAARLLTTCWELRRPSVLLSITGSAQEMKLEPHLELLFKRGLAEAARSTDAWIITGGTDTGVMALVGEAIAVHSATDGERMPCIGIAPYRAVMHKERFHQPGQPGGRIHTRWKKMGRNSSVEAGLDPNHTHFLLVDNDKKGSPFGGEIKFRTELESQLSADMRIPKVLLVLAGGKGTVETVAESVKRKTPVVLVKEAGGASQSIAEFLEPLLRKRSTLMRDTTVLEQHIKTRMSDFEASGRLTELLGKFASDIAQSDWLPTIARHLELVQVFTIKLQDRVPFDVAVLDSIVSAFKLSEDEQREMEERKRRHATLAPLRPKMPPPHRDARSQKNPNYPPRTEVSDERVPWSKEWDAYKPTDWTDPYVLTKGVEQGWADPPDAKAIHSELLKRRSYCGPTEELRELSEMPAWFDDEGRPRNPRGRTGISGRGLLGKWGPNHAADPIVTRLHPSTRKLQVVAIQRKDTGAWALPGGMVDAGEVVSQAVRREFTEEAGTLGTKEGRAKQELLLDQIFCESNRRLVYHGYVDDPRNTDHAWMETTAYHFHCKDALAKTFKLVAGDDAGNVVWLDVDAQTEPRFANLYASHRDWVEKVAHSMNPHHIARSCQHPQYQARVYVPDTKVPWSALYPEYAPLDFTDNSVLTKGVEEGWADPPDASSISDELHETRVSFEGPISFDSLSRPLNPRGRTGVKGRGLLGKWGPNHAADPIVTRFHPRTNQLQVVAIQRKDTGQWALPGGMVDAGEAVSLTVRREFTEEAGAVTDPVEKQVLESMLDELFAQSNGREIYRGYVDDPRNTDNSWVETTAMHFHCPRRLASVLRLEAGDDAGKVTWLDVDINEPRYSALYASHKDWIEIIKKTMSQQQEHPQLLRLVVRWGRRDIAERVLTDPDLLEQRQLPMVQAAFHEALTRSTSPHFEVALVELLLDYGARAEEVYLGGLFKSVQDDLFGYFREISEGFYGGRRHKKSSRSFKRSSTSPQDSQSRRPCRSSHNPSSESAIGDAEADQTNRRLALVVRRVTSSPPAVGCPAVVNEVDLTQALSHSSTASVSFAATARAAIHSAEARSAAKSASKLAAADAQSLNASLWDPSHVAFFSSLVPGFSDYAGTQNYSNIIDIIFWAIACGAFDLAFTLWRRCRSPLRAALLAQHICSTIRKRKRRHVKQLEALEERFCNAALGVLDEFEDQETARRLLQSTFGDFATLGQHGRRRISILDLAIELNNKEFISHRYCQGILDEMWLGRASRCGRVQLSRPHKPWVLFIQILLPFVCVVRLKPNDLFPGFANAATPSSTRYQSFSGLWYIPTVKRMVHLLSLTIFALITVVIALMPTCGPLGTIHFFWLFYLAGYILQEVQQYMQGPELWRRNMYNILDASLISLLVINALLRAIMTSRKSEDARMFSPAADLIDWLNQHRSSDTPLRPSWPWYTHEPENNFLAGDLHMCGWSPMLEAYRTISAVVMVIFALRMLEWFTNNSEMGVLIVIITRMINNVSDWIPILLTITTGFAFAMCVMMPRFKIDNAELGVYPISQLNLDISAGGPFMLPFWGIFGYYEPQDIARAQGSAFLTPLFFWFYLLIALVLMTNLLIAMFNDTYTAVKGKSDEEFMMSRVLKVKGYLVQYVVPVPFNVPFVFWDVTWTCFWRLRLCTSRTTREAAEKKVSRITPTGAGLAASSPSISRPSPTLRNAGDPPSGAPGSRPRVSFVNEDDGRASGVGTPGMQRQSTMAKFQHSRVLLRQNTRRQLATTRAVSNVHVEKDNFDLHVAELSETLARDRYLNLLRSHEAEKRFITSAFKRFEDRMARIEGDMSDHFVEVVGKLRQLDRDQRIADGRPPSPSPVHHRSKLRGESQLKITPPPETSDSLAQAPANALASHRPPPVPSSSTQIDTSFLRKTLDANSAVLRTSVNSASQKVDKVEERVVGLEKSVMRVLDEFKQMVAIAISSPKPPRPREAWGEREDMLPRPSTDHAEGSHLTPPYMTAEPASSGPTQIRGNNLGIPVVRVDPSEHRCIAPEIRACTRQSSSPGS